MEGISNILVPEGTMNIIKKSRTLAALAVAVVILSVTGCEVSDRNEGVTLSQYVPKSRSSRVLVIGDSLTDQARTAGMEAKIRSAGGGSNVVTASATWGWSTAQATAALAKHNPASFDLIVLALGSNDYSRTEAQQTAAINAAMAKTGRTPTVWVNVDSYGKMGAGAARYNKALTAAEKRFSNLTVSDWDTFLRSRPNHTTYRAADRVHYTSAGYRLRASYMADLTSGHSQQFKASKSGTVQVKMTGCTGKVQLRHPAKNGTDLAMSSQWKNIGHVPAGQITQIRLTSNGPACTAKWSYRIA